MATRAGASRLAKRREDLGLAGEVAARELADHPEVEEGDAAVLAEQVVAGVGVAEGEVELAGVRVEEAVDDLRVTVAGRVGLVEDVVEHQAVDPLGDEHAAAAERGVDAGHPNEGMLAPEAGEAAMPGGLELVVALGGDPLGELARTSLTSRPGISRRRIGESMRRLRISDSTASAMPGYWTLTATSAPSWVRPRWTWPMLAAAAGSESISARTSSGLSPHSPSSTPWICFHETGGTSSRSDARRALQVLGLIRVEARELDRGEHLAGLHRRAAHDRELVDERVDRRDHAVAAAALAVGLVAAASRRSPAQRTAPPAATLPSAAVRATRPRVGPLDPESAAHGQSR